MQRLVASSFVLIDSTRTMSLPPQYSGHRIAGSPGARHTLELYLDYVCPFSAKLWNQVFNHVLPWLVQEHPDLVQVR